VKKIGKKGNSAVFMIALLSVVMLGLVYASLREPIDMTLSGLRNSSASYEGTDSEQNIDKMYDVFLWYPIIGLFCIILWAILHSKSKRADEYG